MSEFVLRDDLLNSPCRRLSPAPFEDTLERGMAGHHALKIAEGGVWQTGVIDKKHRHTGTYIGGAPNGPRLSCGRNAWRRKEAEAQTRRLASEATQFLLTCERPSASSAC